MRDSEAERRRHFRVTYPVREQPELVSADDTWRVSELSEGGLRVRRTGHAPAWAVGDAVDGILRFPGGEEVPIQGAVLRVYDRECVVQFTRGVPFAQTLREQQRLLARYPELHRHRRPGSAGR